MNNYSFFSLSEEITAQIIMLLIVIVIATRRLEAINYHGARDNWIYLESW